MQRESLYVISQWGRDRFVWATSAAEARAKAAAPPPLSPPVASAYPAARVSARPSFGAHHGRATVVSEE